MKDLFGTNKMKKNSHIHFVIETEFLEKLKLEANNKGISISELCRMKLYDNVQLDRIERNIKKILEQNGSK